MDVLGKAIWDYFEGNNKASLWVADTVGPKVAMPVATYFRSEKKMPALEKLALASCRGSVLDIGAGAGSHALILQKMGLAVTALDISPLNCKVMALRGVDQVAEADIFQYKGCSFDTLLLLMNGIGLCGSLNGFRKFLKHAATLLKPNGQLIFDSSDIAYLYEDTGLPGDVYYGEFKCRYQYQAQHTEWFTWLYVDFGTMQTIAQELGWRAKLLFEDSNNQYLCCLTRANDN